MLWPFLQLICTIIFKRKFISLFSQKRRLFVILWFIYLFLEFGTFIFIGGLGTTRWKYRNPVFVLTYAAGEMCSNWIEQCGTGKGAFKKQGIVVRASALNSSLAFRSGKCWICWSPYTVLFNSFFLSFVFIIFVYLSILTQTICSIYY